MRSQWTVLIPVKIFVFTRPPSQEGCVIPPPQGRDIYHLMTRFDQNGQSSHGNMQQIRNY